MCFLVDKMVSCSLEHIRDHFYSSLAYLRQGGNVTSDRFDNEGESYVHLLTRMKNMECANKEIMNDISKNSFISMEKQPPYLIMATLFT